MMASRGMGCMDKAKIPGRKVVKRKDKPEDVDVYKKGGKVWDKPRPKELTKPKKLKPAQKAKAKAEANAAGRPYPNLVDNMRAAQ